MLNLYHYFQGKWIFKATSCPHFWEFRISMDHKGRCFDNILVERLWRTLKQEAIFYYHPE